MSTHADWGVRRYRVHSRFARDEGPQQLPKALYASLTSPRTLESTSPSCCPAIDGPQPVSAKIPSKASYTGFGTRLVVERVRHHSCGPSIRPQHSITEWACWNEMGRSGLSMMKAIARVVPTGVCKCRFRHSGATLRTHATKSVSPSVSPGLGTLGDEGPSGPPSWVKRLLLAMGQKHFQNWRLRMGQGICHI